MTSLESTIIGRWFSLETSEQRLKKNPREDFPSLTIIGIARVAFYWIGFIPVMILSLVAGKIQFLLSSLGANQTVHQLTLAKNILVGKLSESLQKNWKSLAIATVTLSGTALIIYLRIPILTDNETQSNAFFTVKNMLVMTGVGVSIAIAAMLVSPIFEEKRRLIKEEAASALDPLVQGLSLLEEKVEITYLEKFALIRSAINAVKRAKVADKATEAAKAVHLKVYAKYIKALARAVVINQISIPLNESFESSFSEACTTVYKTYVIQLENFVSEAEVRVKKIKQLRPVEKITLDTEERWTALMKEERDLVKVKVTSSATKNADKKKANQIDIEVVIVENTLQLVTSSKDKENANLVRVAATTAKQVTLAELEKANQVRIAAFADADEALQQLLQDVDLPENLRSTVERLRQNGKSDQAKSLESFAELLKTAVEANTAQ